jgi:hypothetical protein
MCCLVNSRSRSRNGNILYLEPRTLKLRTMKANEIYKQMHSYLSKFRNEKHKNGISLSLLHRTAEKKISTVSPMMAIHYNL